MPAPAPNVVTLRIHRPWTMFFGDVAGRLHYHTERSKILHGLVEALGIEVKDWGETDGEYPREVVEIVIAIASAAVSAAVAEVVKAWFERGKVRDVEIVRPNGTTISVRGLSSEDLAGLGELLWKRPRTARPKKS